MNITELRIEEIKELEEKNPQMTLSDMAEKYNIAGRSLSRIFKKAAGISFREYKLRKKIIETSKELLKDPALSAGDISMKLGYAYEESFLRAFKRCTQMTTTEYRKKIGVEAHRNKIVNITNDKVTRIQRLNALIDLARTNFVKKHFRVTDKVLRKNLPKKYYKQYKVIMKREKE